MTVLEIMKLAQALSPQERKELVKLLVDSLEVGKPRSNESEEHWRQSLNRLLDELGPIDLVDGEIEDPVEWVKTQQRKEANRLQPYWNDEQ